MENDTSLPAVVARAIALAAKRKTERGLSPIRLQIVFAIHKLGEYAYGHMIVAELRTIPLYAKVAMSQVYTTLRRMEKDGHLTSRSSTSAIPGARRVTVYELTDVARGYLPPAE